MSDSPTYSEVSFKASHNSYDRGSPLATQLGWDELPRPCDNGCRGLELDVNRFSDGLASTDPRFFRVSHDSDSNAPPLSDYLGQLRAWHDAHPNHDVVFVTLDIKSEEGSKEVFPAQIDTYLTTFFTQAPIASQSLIYRPWDLMQRGQPGDSLFMSVVRSGWPTLQDLKGKFIFCLSGTESWKSYYAQQDPSQHLCFADKDYSDDDANLGPQAGDGTRVIFNFHLWTGHMANWWLAIRRFRAARMLVRGYEIDSPFLWMNALVAGVNVLATNQVTGTPWAGVGSSLFWKRDPVFNAPFPPVNMMSGGSLPDKLNDALG